MTNYAKFELTRRKAIGGAAAAALATAGACSRDNSSAFDKAPDWMTLLGKSEKGGRNYTPRTEGDVPASLKGSLYRNGPGLFERGGQPIKHLLDGDGLVQRLQFSERGVHYQNAFVQTEKLVAEEKTGKRQSSTWTTRKSGNPFANIGGGVTASQAGVTVYPVHGKLLARDEVGPSYEINPETLETLGTLPVGENLDGVGFKAHSKLDPETGEWIIAGTQFGPKMKVHGVIYEPNLKLKTQFSFDAPRQVYVHDFIASKNHLIFNLHPCFFSPVPFLAGLKSFTDSFEWKGGEGNIIAVISRHGGEPKFFEAPGSFMWHALNAFEEGDQIIADFVGYDHPDHFIGEDAFMLNIMQGRMGRAAVPGKIRRNVIDLNRNTLKEEILDDGNHEFPMLDGRAAMASHKVGYFACNGLGAFNSGLKRLNYVTGAADSFDFGAQVQVGEPVFAERPGGAIDEGWLLAQCLDGASQKTFFAIFDAETLGQGPVAKIWLDHPVPISFHGSWSA